MATVNPTSHPIRFQKFLLTLYLLTLLTLMVLSAIIPKGDDVILINGNNNLVFDFFFSTITNLGDGIIFLPIIVFFLFKRFYYSILGATLSVAHGLLCVILKRGFFYNAKRPLASLDHELLHFVPNVNVYSQHSFPSGHTATIFSAAVFLSLLSKNRIVSVLLIGIALTVGYSRVYLLQHFLIDVTAGALVGAGTAFLVWHLFEQRQMPTWMNNNIRFNLNRRKKYSYPRAESLR